MLKTLNGTFFLSIVWLTSVLKPFLLIILLQLMSRVLMGKFFRRVRAWD